MTLTLSQNKTLSIPVESANNRSKALYATYIEICEIPTSPKAAFNWTADQRDRLKECWGSSASSSGENIGLFRLMDY